MSRKHVIVRATARGFEVNDAGSRNGTFVDGERVEKAPVHADDGSIVRCGQSLVLLVSDVRRFEEPQSIETDDAIVGPTLRSTWNTIHRLAKAGESLLILGESGSGKELAARAFHEGTGRSGPFLAVNCAAIPAGVAERLLFGARRGAYSGADKDSEGYLQAADGGTLFLDEVAELELDVQAKLLRAIETRTILPLGASRALPVDVRVCAATHTNLRQAVARGTFREDLYFRLGRPEVRVPSLRERKEEIPWLIARELGKGRAHVSLVEECLVRTWPGNVRELRAEVRIANASALEADREQVTVEDLSETAGTDIRAVGSNELVVNRRRETTGDDVIRAALARAKGNVTEASRILGMHRTQLRRWIARQTEG